MINFIRKITREEIEWFRQNNKDEYDRRVQSWPTFAAYDYIEVKGNNIANRKSPGRNGTKYDQEIGLEAQWLIEFLTTGRLTKPEGFDDGIDLKINGRKVDVKTRKSKKAISSEYLHNILASQLQYQTEYYIFVNYIETIGVYQICGILSKEEIINNKDKYLYKAGSTSTNNSGHVIKFDADTYCIPNGDLHEIKKIQDIYNIIRPKK